VRISKHPNLSAEPIVPGSLESSGHANTFSPPTGWVPRAVRPSRDPGAIGRSRAGTSRGTSTRRSDLNATDHRRGDASGRRSNRNPSWRWLLCARLSGKFSRHSMPRTARINRGVASLDPDGSVRMVSCSRDGARTSMTSNSCSCHREQTPHSVDALELVVASVVKGDARSGYEVNHRFGTPGPAQGGRETQPAGPSAPRCR
jgi:hypothetical protein